MSVADLIAEARRAGAELVLDGTELRVRAPRGALGPELRARLAAEREAIKAVLASARGASVQDPIPAFPPEQPAPLSQAQQRLWFLDRLNPGTAFLNLPATLRMRGPLDVDALRWTVREIGRRHDALRTAVVVEHGEPLQVVRPLELELEVVDFSHLTEPKRTRSLMARRAEELTRPFSVDQAPLIRFFLLVAAPDDNVFLFVASHLVFDGWSHDILFRELKALYEARLAGTPMPPAPEVRLADFVRWQRERLAGGAERAPIERIKAQLDGMPGTIELPTDRPRAAEPSHRGTRHVMPLERDLVARLRRVAVAHGATLNMLALASIELLLARYSGQNDFGIGVPSRGRTRPECEGVIGMFVNTLVLRSDVSAGGRFSDLLRRVKDSSLEALAHEEIPFEALVQALRPVRQRNRTPLFQVMFSYQEASARLYRIHDLTLEQIPSYSGSSAYDLTFWLRDHGTTAFAAIEICADLFMEATGEWLCKNWRAVLEAIADNPELPLDQISMLERESPAGVDVVRERIAPRTDVERSLARIWSSALGTNDFGVTDDFFELGGTSLMAVEIFDELRALNGVELPIAALLEYPTIERLAARLGPDGRRFGGLWSTVVPIRTSGTLPALFCISGAGGNPLHLRHLAAALGPAQPFFGVQYRGVDGRRTPHRTIADMAAESVADIRKLQPHGPYYLAGCGAGGLAAYDAARRLRALGQEVGLVVLLATLSPLGRTSIAQRFSARVAELRARPDQWAEHALDGAQRWLSAGRRAVAARRAAREPFRYRNDAVLQAALEAERDYRPEPYDGDVLLVAPSGPAADDPRGWKSLVRGSLEVDRVECSDGDVTSSDAAPSTAGIVARALARARARKHV